MRPVQGYDIFFLTSKIPHALASHHTEVRGESCHWTAKLMNPRKFWKSQLARSMETTPPIFLDVPSTTCVDLRRGLCKMSHSFMVSEPAPGLLSVI